MRKGVHVLRVLDAVTLLTLEEGPALDALRWVRMGPMCTCDVCGVWCVVRACVLLRGSVCATSHTP